MDAVSVVGLGKLGQCLAVSFASRGFEVLGVDISKQVVDSINNGRASVIEPKLQDCMDQARQRLRATSNHEEAINETDVTFILVPTPSDHDGSFSSIRLESALEALARGLKRSNKRHHLFVINSTVMPGSIQQRLIPLVESLSGRGLNDGFGVCYCPELVALGSVVRDFLNPDFVVIGQSNSLAGDRVASIYRKLCVNDPPVFQMPIIDAEITKVSLNCYITLKISFANMLANLCERVPGADVDLITTALGADRRIAPYYLRGGLSYGGTCFPRDTKAFIAFAKEFCYDAELIRATEEVNGFQDRHLADLVLREAALTGERRVSVLGLAFKPNTPVVVESPAIKLISALLERGIEVTAYDPLAVECAREVLGSKIHFADSARSCVSWSSLCVVATPWEEFKRIDASYLVRNPTTVIDCWRLLDPSALGERARYIALGRAPVRLDVQHAVPGEAERLQQPQRF